MKIFCCLFLMLMPSFSGAAMECPVATGDLVELNDLNLIYNKFKEMSVIKGEFETTEQFNKRVEESNAITNRERFYILEGLYD